MSRVHPSIRAKSIDKYNALTGPRVCHCANGERKAARPQNREHSAQHEGGDTTGSVHG